MVYGADFYLSHKYFNDNSVATWYILWSVGEYAEQNHLDDSSDRWLHYWIDWRCEIRWICMSYFLGQSKMDRIKSIAKLMVLTGLFSGFFFSGLLINSIQLVLWLTVRPFSRWLYRKINAYLLFTLWSRNINYRNKKKYHLYLTVFKWIPEVLILMDWSGSMCAIYTDDETWFKLGQENALILMNHSNELDWLVGWVMADQVNILGVSCALNQFDVLREVNVCSPNTCYILLFCALECQAFH